MDTTRPSLPLSLVAVAAFAVGTGCSDHSSGSSGSPSPTITGPVTVAYETRREINAGVGKTADADVADLNGDGILDLAVADLAGQVRILIGQNGGVFGLGPVVAVRGKPIAVRAADLDRDGDADLVVVSTGADRGFTLRNDGSGSFVVASEFPVAPLPTSMVVGDCTGDAVPDVVVSHFSNSNVLMFVGNGDATIAPTSHALPASLGERTTGMMLGDVNDDGLTDMLVCDTDNDRVVILVGESAVGGGVTHTRAVPVRVGRQPVGISLGDVTADGRVDIAVSCVDDAEVTILSHNPARDRFEGVRRLRARGQPGLATIADVTGDDVNDLIVTVLDRSAVSVFAGAAGGLEDRETRLPSSGFPHRPIVADLDGDGVRDLLVVPSRGNVLNLYTGRADGGLNGARAQLAGSQRPAFVTAADFNGDQRTDLCVGGPPDEQVVFHATRTDEDSGDPILAEVLRLSMPSAVRNVYAADVNRDSRTDVLVAVEGGVRLLANTTQNGVLSFDELPSAADDYVVDGRGSFEMFAGDLNGDSVPDLAVTFFDEDRLKVVYGQPANGEFAFSDPFVTPLGGSPIGLAAGDFDGDGQQELAVSRFGVARVSVLERDPSGIWVKDLDVPVGAEPNYLRTADFDLDGRDDLVVSNYLADAITVLVAAGDGGFRTVELRAGERPTALLTQDLNVDGNPDILVASLSSSEFRVLLGDGAGSFTQALVFPGVFGATGAALGDLNGNGLLDLAISGVRHRRLTLFKNISAVPAGN